MNCCLHHNPGIFGNDHDQYDPERLLDSDNAPSVSLLMHFEEGHHQCIGRNTATMSIGKIFVTITRNYGLEMLDKTDPKILYGTGIGEKEGTLMVRAVKR